MVFTSQFRRSVLSVVAMLTVVSMVGCQQRSNDGIDADQTNISEGENDAREEIGVIEDDLEFEFVTDVIQAAACRQPTVAQLSLVDQGNTERNHFLKHCSEQTNSSPWCEQLVRPNPNSRKTFECTYGTARPHQLIHPDQSTWKYAYQAVQLIEELEAKGIKVCQIYNWWRPEPYNASVGGAAGRHPYGTSVDVRFCTKSDQAKAHAALCKERSRGRLRALGYYSGTALHLGVGDRTANTWGKRCP